MIFSPDFYWALYIFLQVSVFQAFITFEFTNTKEFSKRALLRNLSVVYSIHYSTIISPWILLCPIFLEIALEYMKYKGIYIDKYIATKYQYNDYWRNINKNDKIFSNFSEANYDTILGLNTTDLSQNNIQKILEWTQTIYNKSFSLTNNHSNIIELTPKQLKTTTDTNKFKLICEKCNVQPGMTILEIGFGEGDFMNYIYETYGIKPVGVSISSEQVRLIKNQGYNAYEMDSWNMTPEFLGKYDLVLQCGNLEYVKCQGEPDETYFEFCKIIKSILNPNGKYFVTCIHLNDMFTPSLYDKLRCYFLWSGNDGSYPKSKNGFSKHAENAGLVKLYQEDRTIDYWITTVIFMSYLQFNHYKKDSNIVFTYNGFVEAIFKTIAAPYYLHTYLCYSPTSDYFWLPWLWEFVPQYRNGKLEFPVTLEYILFQYPELM